MSEVSEKYFKYHYTQKARFWRICAFIAAALVGLLFFTSLFSSQKHGSFSAIDDDFIAEIAIDGVIADASEKADNILSLRDNPHIKAVIVGINSPGGTTYDSEILYNNLMALSETKPVVTYMKNVAASGGYIVALSGEKIFAAENTITGSIGVLMQIPNAKKLMDQIGIKVTEVKSSPIKGEPNYFSETPKEALKNLQAMVNDTNNWFADIVRQRRQGIPQDRFAGLVDGRVFTGRQAVTNQLVDAIGGKKEAKAYLVQAHGFDQEIEVSFIETNESQKEELIHELLGAVMTHFKGDIRKFMPFYPNNIDGSLSLWQG